MVVPSLACHVTTQMVGMAWPMVKIALGMGRSDLDAQLNLEQLDVR